MAKQKRQKARRDNALVRYFRETRAELRRIRWPTRDEAWMMTKIVLAVTAGMAIFLGALDTFFAWLLGGVVTRDPLFIAMAVVVIGALAGAAYLIGQGEEA